MRRIALFFCMAVVAITAAAQTSMGKLFIAMPDSLVGYLNTTKRTEMVDFYHMGVKAETFNRLQNYTVLDSLTERSAELTLSEASTMQLVLLPTSQGDSIICMVRTYLGEAPESTVSFFDTTWQPLSKENRIVMPDSSAYTHRPDSMSVEEYERLLRLIDPVMLHARLDITHPSLVFSLSTPMVRKTEKQQLNAILVERKLNWNGESFN